MVRAVVLRAALGVLCAAALAGCSGDSPEDEPAGAILASVRVAEDRSALFLVGVDGSVRRLTPQSPPTIHDFEVSPDGLVAFAAADEGADRPSVWTVGADGRELRRIGPGTYPAWSRRGELAYFELRSGDPGGTLVINDLRAGSRREFPLRLRRSERPEPGPRVSPDGSRIALDVSDEAPDAGTRVHLIDAGTGQRRPIPTDAWSEGGAAWSPDGDVLAFLSMPTGPELPITQNLVVSRPDGTGRRTIAHGVSGFAWAGTGKRLAYSTESGTLFVRDGLGGAPRRIGRHPGYRPAWAPDGDAILIRTGDGFAVVPLDGGNPVELPGATSAAWLPDGRVLFLRTRRLYVTGAGAGDPIELIRPSSYDDASWSPDGRRLAYVRADSGYGEGRGDITVVDVDGGASTVVGTGTTPSWSPNGRRLAFEREGDVYIASLGGRATKVTSGSERDRLPRWSARGDMLAFSRSVGTPRPNPLASAACVVVLTTEAVACSNALRPRKPALIEEGPVWSPVADVVAYASYSNEPTGYYLSAEVCFLEAPTATKRGCVQEENELSAPAWSADGQALSVVGAVDGGIGIASRSGRIVSGLPGDGGKESWAPRGRLLAAGGDALSVIDARPGAQARRLVETRVGPPAWAPDARWLAYATGREIGVVSVDGGDPEPVASLPAEVEYLRWRPRGRRNR